MTNAEKTLNPMKGSNKGARWVYVIAIVLLIIWVIGFFIYPTGYLIHIVLVTAIVAVVLGLLRTRDE
ncbi:MAG TPA: lmo0937 family membrane protein [Bacteroidales bacterium]|nr:lmo0937 family membrane protein [Bacteroidales bacterium]